jgi:tRNA A-37 threonylcarbamoyl transferase component Bud32
MNIEAYLSKLKIGEVAIQKKMLGGNSSVYKGILNDGTIIAVKKYRGDKQRIERMLSRERDAVDFLRKNGVSNIPELLEVRKDLGLIVFRWIEGIRPQSNHESMNAILEMCTVLNEIYMNGSEFESAIDPGFSGLAIETQIRSRTRKLQTLYPFVWIEDIANQISDRLRIYESDPRKNIVFHQRTLSFSDLGIHNMIYCDGRFSFIDFEFFGTDSVNKLVGDFLLHPRNDFNKFEITRFIEFSNKIFKWRFEELEGFLPLLTLKWAIIAYGRTLRDLRQELHDGRYNPEIMKSKGAMYLDYFDWLCLSENIEKFTTFRAFEGMVNR